MFCSKCGYNIGSGMYCCPNCGALAVMNNLNTPRTADAEAKRRTTLSTIKGFFSSSLYLFLVLFSMLCLILRICQMAFYEGGLYSVDVFRDTFPDLVYHNVIDYIGYAVAAVNVLWVVSMLAVVVLRYLIYSSAVGDESKPLGAKSIVILKWVYLVECLCAVIPVLIYIGCLFTPIARVNLMNGRINLLDLIDIILPAVLSTAFAVLAMRSIGRLLDTVRSGIPNSKISLFAPIYLLVTAASNASRYIYILSGDWFEVLVSLSVAANSLVLALVFFKYRSLMYALQKK